MTPGDDATDELEAATAEGEELVPVNRVDEAIASYRPRYRGDLIGWGNSAQPLDLLIEGSPALV